MVYNPKTQPEPNSLAVEKIKKKGQYNGADVLTQLKTDFRNKCYICEAKAPTNINVEHFVPYKDNIDLKFDWNNLFYSCGTCNNIKGTREGLLNCTEINDAVETNIKYRINPFPKEKAVIEPVGTDQKVTNTVALLLDAYNGTTPHKALETANLRDLLLKEIRTFQDLLFCYDDDSNTPEEKEEYMQDIKRALRPTSAFTAFKTWIIRDKKDDFPEFLDCI